MFRFSRTKLFGRVTYQEFMDTANEIARMARSELPEAEVKVLTYERFPAAQKYPRAHVTSDSGMPGGGQASYDLTAFSLDNWKNTQEVQLTIRDISGETSFMVTVSCRPSLRPGVMDFYGQCVSENLLDRIYNSHAQSRRPFTPVSRGNQLAQSLVGGMA